MEQKQGDILSEAHTVINGARQDQYGKPEDNFARIADLWNSLMGDKLARQLVPSDVALMMCAFKMARIQTGVGTRDSFVDLAGYAALAFDLKQKEAAA